MDAKVFREQISENYKELKEIIYDLMIGTYDLKHYPIKESKYVDDEYAEGKFCGEAYAVVYDAKCRICDRLDSDEDDDVEEIIDNLLGIGKYLSMKMFDYGVLFSSPFMQKIYEDEKHKAKG